MRECARQNNAADAAGRGACDAVDDDPQAKGPPYRLQECKIDILGIMRSPVIAICGFITSVYSLLRLWDRMICLGRSRKLQDFFDYAMHIEHERHAAIADQSEPQFLFLHGATPWSSRESAPNSETWQLRRYGSSAFRLRHDRRCYIDRSLLPV